MDFYGKEILIECCYDFLCSKPSDDINEIRKKFYYLLNYSNRYETVIHFYHQDDEIEDEEKAIEYRHSVESNKLFKKNLCDSYLAIILYQTGRKEYKNVLVGLCNYFDIITYHGKHKITSLFEKIIDDDIEELILTKDDYFKELNYSLHPSTNVGIYKVTFSLSSIIEFEKDNLFEVESVKCLKKINKPIYGELS